MSIDTTPTSPATDDARLADLQARRWYARRSALLAEIEEAEALAERLPIEAEQAREELERAKLTLQYAKEAHDAAEGKFRLLGEQVRAAKRRAAELTAELQAHAGTISASLNQLRDLITRGHADSARWREIYKVIELSGRCKEREIRRLVLMEHFVSAEDLLAIIGQIANIAARTITDRAALRAFVDEIDRMIPSAGHSDSPGILARAALPRSCDVSEPAQVPIPLKRTSDNYGEKQEETPEQPEREVVTDEE